MTYAHPMVEVSPGGWPLSDESRKNAQRGFKSHLDMGYQLLASATEKPGFEYVWQRNEEYPSWSEHRRRKILQRAIEACELFGVRLLVLPEYSVRRDTVDWLKDLLVGKNVAVLAGTYMEFQESGRSEPLTATMTLLWPVPAAFLQTVDPDGTAADRSAVNRKSAHRGLVMEWHRGKKYRSMGMHEFLRPETKVIGPLFQPSSLIDEFSRQFGISLSGQEASRLLSSEQLGLKHVMELVCSEVFLATSPANIDAISADFEQIRARFGVREKDANLKVMEDIRSLGGSMSLIGHGFGVRRSILAVPAATTRTADYWITGQASLLSGGITTIFCNSTEHAKGGSCFIGRESWKSGKMSQGYIAAITPYHGWSKGIYYNDANDPLSKDDQAVVIADIDPMNMLEGNPRPQMMPVPLQLVAYLPIVETCKNTSLDECADQAWGTDPTRTSDEVNPAPAHNAKDWSSFWDAVRAASDDTGDKSLKRLSKEFADERAFYARTCSYLNHGQQQPAAPKDKGLFSAPALYDWLEVDITVNGKDIPKIRVPPWLKAR